MDNIVSTVAFHAGTRIYYFDRRVDANGSEYLTIAEVARDSSRRNCIDIWPEDVANFIDSLIAILQTLQRVKA